MSRTKFHRIPEAVQRYPRCAAEPGPTKWKFGMDPGSAAHRKGAAQYPGQFGEIAY